MGCAGREEPGTRRRYRWRCGRLQRAVPPHPARLDGCGAARAGRADGRLRLAHTEDRVDEFRHVTSQARAQHLEVELLSPSQIKARHPFLELDGIRLGLWDPSDGDIDPAQLTQALAKGARDLGATVYRHTRVTAIRELSAGGWRIETPAGSIETEYVIHAAGYPGGEGGPAIGEDPPAVA